MAMRPEEEFIRYHLSFHRAPKSEWLQPTRIDWTEVLSIAAKQHVTGVLFEAIRNQNTTAVPHSVLKALEDASTEIAGRNRMHYRALQTLSTALGQAGLPFILLKGMALLCSIYTDDLHLRSCRDIDILVRKEELARVHDLLATLGYHHVSAPWRERDRTYQLPDYQKPDEPTRIDVHYDLIEPDAPLQIDIDEFWQRARRIAFNGQEMLIFSPEDMLLHRAIHVSCHKEFVLDTLRQLRDLGDIISTFPIQWDLVANLARRYRADRSLYHSLRLARTLLHAPVPEGTLSSLGSEIESWEGLLLEELERDGNLLSQRDPLRLFVQAFLMQIAAYDGSERFQFLRRALRHPIRSNPRHMRDLLPLDDYEGRFRLAYLWLGARLLTTGARVGLATLRRSMRGSR